MERKFAKDCICINDLVLRKKKKYSLDFDLFVFVAIVVVDVLHRNVAIISWWYILVHWTDYGHLDSWEDFVADLKWKRGVKVGFRVHIFL